MKYLAYFAALFTALVSINTYAGDGPETDSDSGIEGPPYANIVEQMQNLATTYDTATIHNYGKSVSNKNLIAMKISFESRGVTPQKSVLITGATHGNEYLNIADRLPKFFLENQDSNESLKSYLEAGGNIYIVPILNPDGYDRDRRENNRGKDLNRDFDLLPMNSNRFTQPETKKLVEFIEEEHNQKSINLQLALDYHCCIGALLYPWSYSKTRQLPDIDKQRHISITEFMKQELGRNYRQGTTYEVLGYAPWGTSKDYYYSKYNAIAFTYEGKRNIEDQRFSEHTRMWIKILNYLND